MEEELGRRTPEHSETKGITRRSLPTSEDLHTRGQCCKQLLISPAIVTAMGSRAIDYRIASEEILIELCHSSSSPELNDPCFRRNGVGQKSPDQAAIKYCFGITRWEAARREKASRYANGTNILRIWEVDQMLDVHNATRANTAVLPWSFLQGCSQGDWPGSASRPRGTDHCFLKAPRAGPHSESSASPGSLGWKTTTGLHHRR